VDVMLNTFTHDVVPSLNLTHHRKTNDPVYGNMSI